MGQDRILQSALYRQGQVISLPPAQPEVHAYPILLFSEPFFLSWSDNAESYL